MSKHFAEDYGPSHNLEPTKVTPIFEEKINRPRYVQLPVGTPIYKGGDMMCIPVEKMFPTRNIEEQRYYALLASTLEQKNYLITVIRNNEEHNRTVRANLVSLEQSLAALQEAGRVLYK